MCLAHVAKEGRGRLNVCIFYRNAELHSLQDFGVFGLSYMLPQQLDCHCLRNHDAMTKPGSPCNMPKVLRVPEEPDGRGGPECDRPTGTDSKVQQAGVELMVAATSDPVTGLWCRPCRALDSLPR